MASVTIELHVFSGLPNPKWELNETHTLHGDVVEKLIARDVAKQEKFPEQVLGYRGFTAGIRNIQHVIIRAKKHALERLLLSTKPTTPSTGARDHDLIMHVLEQLPDEAHGSKAPVKPPVYEPEKWNIPTVQPYNNCYNYANNMITYTFAQPGRAHGFPSPIEQIIAERVSFLAKKDGLIDVPAKSQAELPKTDENLVALVIWPNSDFHWYRQDANKYFSHKPGQTKVRDVDNKGARVEDPRNAARGPYTVFYGFMGTTQGTVEIK